MSVLEWLDAFIPLIAVVIASSITIVFVECYNRKKEKNKMKVKIIVELSLLIEMNNRLILMYENIKNPIEIEFESTEFLSKMYILFHKMRAYLGIKESKLIQAGINLKDIEKNLEVMRGAKSKPTIIHNLFTSTGNIFNLIHKS